MNSVNDLLFFLNPSWICCFVWGSCGWIYGSSGCVLFQHFLSHEKSTKEAKSQFQNPHWLSWLLHQWPPSHLVSENLTVWRIPGHLQHNVNMNTYIMNQETEGRIWTKITGLIWPHYTALVSRWFTSQQGWFFHSQFETVKRLWLDAWSDGYK